MSALPFKCPSCGRGYRDTGKFKRHKNREMVKQKLIAARTLLFDNIPLLPAMRMRP